MLARPGDQWPEQGDDGAAGDPEPAAATPRGSPQWCWSEDVPLPDVVVDAPEPALPELPEVVVVAGGSCTVMV